MEGIFKDNYHGIRHWRFDSSDGWLPWEGDFALTTLYYGEFNNVGAGANTNARVKWIGRKDINRDEAITYTVEPFLQGTWIMD